MDSRIRFVGRQAARFLVFLALISAVQSAFGQNQQTGSRRRGPKGQVNGLFTLSLSSDVERTTAGVTTVQKPDTAAGFMVGYTRTFSPWASLEGHYGFNRNTQVYSGGATASVESNAHMITADLRFQLPPKRFKAKPYGLIGLGALILSPTAASQTAVPGVQKETREVFLYGGGAELPLNNKLGIRIEYRGYLYGSPDFGLATLRVKNIMHTGQPSFGMYYKF